MWNANEGLDRLPINDNLFQENMPPADFEDGSEDLIIDRGALETWFDQLQDRFLIGHYHGPRPSMEALKNWVAASWENKNIFPNHIQYLPNNYYLFFFDDNNGAFQVISRGQWIIKSTPLSFFKWHRGFDPRGDKPLCIPIWVDFPDLPVDYYPWLKNLGAKIRKALGQKSRGGINPKWDPQLLIEINLNKPLKNDISIKDSDEHLWHSQKIVYRNLPNSCFKCHAQGHQIKDCPEMEKNKANKQGDEDKEKKGAFQQIPKKNFGKGAKAQKGNGFKSYNRFEALLEDVFDPLINGTSEMDPLPAKVSSQEAEFTLKKLIMKQSPLRDQLASNKMQGIQVPGSTKQLCLQQFADDTNAIMKADEQSSITFLKCLETFCLASGSQINHSKTGLMPLIV
ncbi:hypothetical protein L7F22_015687 [Adiantum nelumboides]|nr:hypothetical protein [Adiantum nelumboides]